MIDTHCHLTFEHYAGRVSDVLADARAAGVRGVITVSTSSADCEKSLALAHAHENLWCTAGVHPLYSHEQIDWTIVKQVACDPRCVAWGELGLDNHYTQPPAHIQRAVLDEQLALIETCRTQGLDKPVVVHCREAYDDLLAVFRHSSLDPARMVFHCFTGTEAEARKVLDFGAWISFTGVVTFKNAGEVAAAARMMPLDRIMVETDAPFLTPEPFRTIRPNEPKYVVEIARRIAQLRDMDERDLETTLDANAERFFNITLPPAEVQP